MRTNEEILKLAMEDYNTAMEDYTLVDRYGVGHSQGLNRIVSEVWTNFGLTNPVEAIKREDIAPVIKELIEDFEDEIGWVDDEFDDKELEEIDIDIDDLDDLDSLDDLDNLDDLDDIDFEI